MESGYRDLYAEYILKGKGSDITINFPQPIIIPTQTHEGKVGLKNLVLYNNIPNVTENKNNKLRIKVPTQAEYITFSLDTGAYELSMINEQIQEFIQVKYPALKDVEKNFKLIGNDATSRCEFLFKADYGVDFNVEHSLNKLLGFEKTDKHLGRGRFIASHGAKIVKVTSLIVNCNILESNYINSQQVPFIYNTTINVPSGYRLMREINNIAYKRLTTSQISSIRVWLVDQDNESVDLRDDDLLVTLSLRLIPLVPTVELRK